MGQSTNGQICFGVMLPEGFQVPWDDEPYDGDEEKWWRTVNGYTPPFELYDAKGEYLDGKEPTDDQRKEYFDHQKKWDRAHPMPVQLVDYCAAAAPMYILAVPETFLMARRGDPTELDPAKDFTVRKMAADKLEKFIATYLTVDLNEVDLTMKWWLSSYWG